MGDIGHKSIEVIDYRPYKYGDTCNQNDSSFLVNNVDMFPCREDDHAFHVYNKYINVTTSVTNIKVKFTNYLPQMMWLHTTGNLLSFYIGRLVRSPTIITI